jgi:hypothetical protein
MAAVTDLLLTKLPSTDQAAPFLIMTGIRESGCRKNIAIAIMWSTIGAVMDCSRRRAAINGSA